MYAVRLCRGRAAIARPNRSRDSIREPDIRSLKCSRSSPIALRTQLRERLGLREAAESRASALVRGTIQRYEADIPIGLQRDEQEQTSARRQLQISVDIEMIDQVTGKTLWQQKGLMKDGQYEERGEAAGRKQAIERIVNDVIQGAQSQW